MKKMSVWSIVKEKGVPIYVSIIELILSKIKKGELRPGERLPSERQLAVYFEVNRSTVVHALDELVALGWLIRKRGSGTLVNEGKWGISTTSRINWHRYLDQNVFNQNNPYANKIHQLLNDASEETIDLYTGELPLDIIPTFSFPSLTWQQFLEEEQQQDDLGYLPLRQAIRHETKMFSGLDLSTENLLITSGAQQALFLILQVLLQQGDSVAIEDPSFLYALPIFQATGIRLYGIDMDHDGINLSSLEQMIRQHRIKMVMVNPSFQNPTGKTMSVKKRQHLIQLCQKYELPIIEDDVFGKLNFIETAEVPPLKKMDPENVLYIGSLSKILGATTKIGWLSAPQSINQQLAEARKMMDFSLSIFPQVLANLALSDHEFSSKMNELKATLIARRDLVYKVMKTLNNWDVMKPKGGLYLWATWKERKLKQKQFNYFLEEGIILAPSFFFSEQKNSIRINFSRINETNIAFFEQKMKQITEKIASD